ncbi:MAG: hypothetical protein HFJ85_06055 [Oscillospiraceae bacterium]|nr:hypothetical protein [Oscillospiraceae bacterium]
MITIILYGESGEKNLDRIFEKNLKRNYQVHMVAERGIATKGSGKELLFLNSNHIAQVCGGPSVLVLKPNAVLTGLSEIRGNVIALVHSACSEQLKLLAEKKIRTVVCGMSTKDTVTLSSFNDNRAAVSLQRTVENPDGKPVEPMEITLELGFPYDPLSVLLYTAAMMICGAFSPQEDSDTAAANYLM